jgi:hypothetical protein
MATHIEKDDILAKAEEVTFLLVQLKRIKVVKNQISLTEIDVRILGYCSYFEEAKNNTGIFEDFNIVFDSTFKEECDRLQNAQLVESKEIELNNKLVSIIISKLTEVEDNAFSLLNSKLT